MKINTLKLQNQITIYVTIFFFIRDVIWMAWVLAIGIIEAILRQFNNNLYLIIEDDGWAVSLLKKEKNDKSTHRT